MSKAAIMCLLVAGLINPVCCCLGQLAGVVESPQAPSACCGNTPLDAPASTDHGPADMPCAETCQKGESAVTPATAKEPGTGSFSAGLPPFLGSSVAPPSAASGPSFPLHVATFAPQALWREHCVYLL